MKPKSPQPAQDRLRHALSSQVIEKVFTLVVGIVMGAWMARHLGPADIGRLSYVSAVLGILAPLSSLGVRESLSVLLCQENAPPNLVPTALVIELMGTAVIGLVIAPLALKSADAVLVPLFALAWLGNLFTCAEVFEVKLLSTERATVLAGIGMLQTLADSFLRLSALIARAPLLVFAALQTLSLALRGLLLWITVPNGKRAIGVQREAAQALIRRGLPMLLGGIAVSLYMRSDQVMLQWLRGPEEVGQYAVAVRASESLFFMPMVLATTLFPQLIRRSATAEGEASAWRDFYRQTWLLGAGNAAATLWILPTAVSILYGQKFSEAAAVLPWLAPAAFAVCTGIASSHWLQSRNLEWVSTTRVTVGCVCNIVLNAMLIPALGGTGAAIATSISYCIATVLIPACAGRAIRDNTMMLILPFRR